jgi:hypothetical protein
MRDSSSFSAPVSGERASSSLRIPRCSLSFRYTLSHGAIVLVAEPSHRCRAVADTAAASPLCDTGDQPPADTCCGRNICGE